MIVLVFALILKYSEAHNVENVIEDIQENGNFNFSTVVIFHENKSYLPQIRSTVPQIIISNISIFNRNENTLTVVLMETLNILESVAYFLHQQLNSKVLLIPTKNNISKTSIFEKCYNLDLPSVVLKINESYFSYCFKMPVNIYPIKKHQVFEKYWIKNYFIGNCTWEVEILSRSNKLWQFREVYKTYGERINAKVKVVNPETFSSKVNMVMSLENLNSSYYEVTNFLTFISLALIVPAQSETGDNFKLYIYPFDNYVWMTLGISTFYIGAVLSIVG